MKYQEWMLEVMAVLYKMLFMVPFLLVPNIMQQLLDL